MLAVLLVLVLLASVLISGDENQESSVAIAVVVEAAPIANDEERLFVVPAPVVHARLSVTRFDAATKNSGTSRDSQQDEISLPRLFLCLLV